MTSTKQQLFMAFIASMLLLTGCSTKIETTAKADKAAAQIVIPEAPIAEKMDLSKFAPITETSTKEEVFAYASALMTHERYQDAEPMLRSLMEKHPELAGPQINLAICYFHTHQNTKAETLFKQALALKPINAVAHDYLGRIYRTEGKFATAREHYLKAIEVEPNYAPAQRNLAILYDLYLAQPKDALVHYQNYQRLAKEADKHVAIWIRDLANRTGTPVETNTENSKEEL